MNDQATKDTGTVRQTTKEETEKQRERRQEAVNQTSDVLYKGWGRRLNGNIENTIGEDSRKRKKEKAVTWTESAVDQYLPQACQEVAEEVLDASGKDEPLTKPEIEALLAPKNPTEVIREKALELHRRQENPDQGNRGKTRSLDAPLTPGGLTLLDLLAGSESEEGYLRGVADEGEGSEHDRTYSGETRAEAIFVMQMVLIRLPPKQKAAILLSCDTSAGRPKMTRAQKQAAREARAKFAKLCKEAITFLRLFGCGWAERSRLLPPGQAEEAVVNVVAENDRLLDTPVVPAEVRESVRVLDVWRHGKKPETVDAHHLWAEGLYEQFVKQNYERALRCFELVRDMLHRKEPQFPVTLQIALVLDALKEVERARKEFLKYAEQTQDPDQRAMAFSNAADSAVILYKRHGTDSYLEAAVKHGLKGVEVLQPMRVHNAITALAKGIDRWPEREQEYLGKIARICDDVRENMSEEKQDAVLRLLSEADKEVWQMWPKLCSFLNRPGHLSEAA